MYEQLLYSSCSYNIKIMITQEEYIKRVNENTLEWNKQRKEKSFDITKFHGFDARAGDLNHVVLLKKVHDIYGAIVLGFLPFLSEQCGADAVKLSDNSYEHVELKTCYASVSPKTAFKTKSNTIYYTKDVEIWDEYVDKSKTQLIESTFSAAFSIKNNLHTKHRETYIIAIDGNNGDIIDVFYLPGSIVVDYLKSSKDIKLGTFMKKGIQFRSETFNAIGWKNWISDMLPKLKVKTCESKSTKQRRLSRNLVVNRVS